MANRCFREEKIIIKPGFLKLTLTFRILRKRHFSLKGNSVFNRAG